jgi:hypothetical protein
MPQKDNKRMLDPRPMEGWKHDLEARPGSTTWVTLKDMKNSYPVVQLAEHAAPRRVAGNPAFAWWIQHVLNKRNRMVRKMKAKHWARTRKFGVKIPKTVEEAKRFDAENGDALWWEAACKEMKNVHPAFGRRKSRNCHRDTNKSQAATSLASRWERAAGERLALQLMDRRPRLWWQRAVHPWCQGTQFGSR